jgi:ATP-dependent helicase/nuclease subunit A
MWLPQSTNQTDWTDDSTGGNDLLLWRIYKPNDPAFGRKGGRALTQRGNETNSSELPPNALESLKSRLNWQYPFSVATIETAKTSVTALRQRKLEDDVMDSATWSPESLVSRQPAKIHHRRTQPGKLPATEIGLVHHLFLEHVALGQTASETKLRAEAERLRAAGLLSAEQLSALDFGALANFWQSEMGRKICLQAENVKRELAFTARFGVLELQALFRAGPRPDMALSSEEFVVVQGVADLVVLLPKEIWLMDFKTDAITSAEAAGKAKQYEPQLKVYALALARIYQRPVTECQLHFLAAAKTVRVNTPTAITPT